MFSFAVIIEVTYIKERAEDGLPLAVSKVRERRAGRQQGRGKR